MLGGEKRFNDRLCWALVVPLAALALWAVDLLFFGLELAVEGDRPGAATFWVAPLMSLAGGFAAVRAGASVAPSRKGLAAAALAVMYAAGTAISAANRWCGGASGVWCLAFAALGGAGATGGWASARALPDEPAGYLR